MADTNAQLEELTRLLEQVNYEMNQYGKVMKQTADDIRDAEFKEATKFLGGGINNATKGMEKFGDAAGYVAGAAMSAGKAMLDGKKGASAFNESVDDMAKAAQAASIALALMVPGGPLIKLFFAGLTAAVGAVAAYTKAANTMADQLYKTYSGLSKAGGAAGDGMTGVLKASNQLGLSMEEMGTFVTQISANSKDLALFSGSVYEGRQKLGDMGEALEGSREDFLSLGMGMTDVSEGMLGYLRTQTRLGQSQLKTTDELAAGAKKYLVEQDALTKLTGQAREEREKEREAALSEQRFRAKVEEVRATKGEAAAQRLIETNDLISSRSKDAGQAFRDLSTGMVTSDAAQKGLISTQGELMRVSQAVINNDMSAVEATQKVGNAMGVFAKDMNMLAQAGVLEDFALNFAGMVEMGTFAKKDLVAALAKIKTDQAAVLAGGADPLLKSQAELVAKQIDANEALKDFISKGIGPAQEAMKKLADLTIAGANKLNELTPGGKAVTDDTKQQLAGAAVGGIAGNYAGKKAAGYVTSKVVGKALGGAIGGIAGSVLPGAGTILGGVAGAFVGDAIGEWMGKTFFGGEDAPVTPEARATGGPVTPGKTYKVGEKGEELFTPNVAGNIIPNNKLAGMTSGNNMDNPAASDTIKSLVASLTVVSKSMTTGSREMDDAFDEIVKDSVKLERLTDADTKRAEKYSIAYKSYVDLKTQLMDLETPDLKSQIDILQQKALQTSTTAGGAATPGSGAPGGTGLKLPTAGSMPAMGGGQGVAGGIASQNDLTKMGLKLKTGDVQAEGSKIDPKIIDLAQQVQANMPNFAYFSGFNDKFHQEKSPSSSHTTGRAMDFALSKQPSVEEGKEITNWLKSMGASVAIDEYNNPSAKATAGHIHAQIPGYADGGLASTPQIAMVAEKGPEAMIPLDNGAIPINLEMPDVKKMFEGMMQSMKDAPEREVTAVASSDNRAMTELVNVMREQTEQLINAMSDMIREQKNSVSVQERILQTSM
jgi:hypothetical protein